MAFLLKLYDSFIDKILDTANLKSENLSDDEEKNQIENAVIEKPNNEITFQQQNKEIVDSNKKKNFNNQNSIDDYMGSPDKFDRTGGKEKLKNKHRKTFNFGVDDFYKNDDVEDYYVGMKNIESDMMEINLDFKGMINSKKTVAAFLITNWIGPKQLRFMSVLIVQVIAFVPFPIYKIPPQLLRGDILHML